VRSRLRDSVRAIRIQHASYLLANFDAISSTLAGVTIT
jgi:hypothetical protein